MLRLKNRMTDMLGISYPIIQAGMAGGPTTPELVAAVSNAGGLGTLGAGYMAPEQIRKVVREIRKRTDSPFAVNLFIPEQGDASKEQIDAASERLVPYRKALGLDGRPHLEKVAESFEEQLAVVLEENVPVFSFTFGMLSADQVEALRRRQIILIGTATTVREALALEENGVDLIVGQGSEAGGHRGTFLGSFADAVVGTMALIPQMVDQVRVPVIAAGGIMDGRGLVASLALGASGVQMGTVFLTSRESGAHPLHQEAVRKSTEESTVITRVFSGKPARGVKNQFFYDMEQYEKSLPAYPIQNALTKDLRSEAAKQGRQEWMSLWCGQAPRLAQKQKGAGEIVADVMQEVRQLLGK